MQLPEDDKHIQPKKYWLDRITVYMGGFLAEELIFHDTATGASNDIQMATNIARRMVCEWGMSEKLGTINYSTGHDNVFLGREISSPRQYSEETAAIIDGEVKRIVREQLLKGKELITTHKEFLTKIAKALLAQETLSSQELNEIIGPLASDNQKRLSERHSTEEDTKETKHNTGDMETSHHPAPVT